MRYTLYKNGQPIIYGLGRSTYLHAFESIKRNAQALNKTVSMFGAGMNLWLVTGDDTYKLLLKE